MSNLNIENCINNIWPRLTDPVQHGEEWLAFCPCHEDGKKHGRRSLSFSVGKNGKPIFYCFAGCTYPELANAFKLDGHENKQLAVNRPANKRKPSGDPVAIYDYIDANGNRVFQTLRYEPKDFRQRRPDGNGGWIGNLNGVHRILFNLPKLISAPVEMTVFIPEGEKDVMNVDALGLLATTSPMGACKWHLVDSSPLNGRNVVILPDNDEAGRRHSRAVANSLHGVAASVKVVELPDLPEKGDVSDWLVAGGNIEALNALVRDAVEYTPTAGNAGTADKVDWSTLHNDYANATLIRQGADERLLFDPTTETWYVWHGHRWCEDVYEARSLAIEELKKRLEILRDSDYADMRFAEKSLNIRRVSDALEMCKNFPDLQFGRGITLDSDPLLLGCENGVIDLRTGQLRDGRREDLITRSTLLNFDPYARCDRWLRFLDEIFCGDKELVGFIHRVVGYLLTGSTVEQMYLLFYGTGANGKSTLLEILLFVLGEYGSNAAFSTFASPKEDTPDKPAADMAALRHARLVTASEVRENTRLNEGRIKSLTGGDTITARIPFARKPIQFSPTFKVMLAVNHLPIVSDTTAGFWRRVRCIRLKASFDPMAEPDIRDKLKAEASGILAWAVQGTLLWQKEGLGTCAAIKTATSDYQQDVDVVGQFLEDRYEILKTENFGESFRESVSNWTRIREIYHDFTMWSDSDDSKSAMSEKSFSNRLREKGIEKRRTKMGVIFAVRIRSKKEV